MCINIESLFFCASGMISIRFLSIVVGTWDHLAVERMRSRPEVNHGACFVHSDIVTLLLVKLHHTKAFYTSVSNFVERV